MENPEQFKLTPQEPKLKGKGHEPMTEEELDKYVEEQFGGRRTSKVKDDAAAAEAFKKVLGGKEKKEQ
ncbi:MAG: hypothetical protein V1845_04005 [bacterium]